jgi:elongation factor P
MPTAGDCKKGTRIAFEGDPYQVVEYSVQTPSARGAATLVKVKLRNLRTKQLLAKTFKSTERLEQPDFEIRACHYLYDADAETCCFMDDETYEQYLVPRSDVEVELGYIRANDPVRAMFFQSNCIGIEVAQTVTLKVVECEPSVRGDTVTAVTKAAKLETGLEVQVPNFVGEGDTLVIDTRDGRYVRRG